MKKKLFKTLAGVVLSLVVATTAVVGVSAAENKARSSEECEHFLQTESRGFVRAEAENSEYHTSTYYIMVTCDDCHAVIDYYNYYEYEPHDMSGYSNGRFCCTVCDYSE